MIPDAKASPETWDSLEAGATHRDFVQATAARNEKIARLAADEENGEPENAESEETAETAENTEEPDASDKN